MAQLQPAAPSQVARARLTSALQVFAKRVQKTQKVKFKNQPRRVRADHFWGSFLNQKHDAVEPTTAGSRKSLLVFIFGSKVGVQKFLKIEFDFGVTFRGSDLV